MNPIDLPGFADPGLGAQACFRAVLDAMARPGRIHAAGDGLTPPAPLDPATAAVLLTLVDGESPLWLDAAFAPARDWIAFHCGAVAIPAIGQAAFVLAGVAPPFAQLDPGTDEAPEQSATLILQARGLGVGRALRLAGPGLAAPTLLAVDGLPEDFVAAWAANHAAFPRGIDIILCAGSRLAALPRSLSIEEA
jgi:alpha-D-ribose 1-methylphosphonate 5-triphosphate synthase subunit PhnH